MDTRRHRDRDGERLVWSSQDGRVRERAGSVAPAPQPGAPPADGVVRVSRTKAGRGGKTVTLVTGIPAAEAPAVAKELRRACGSGGALKDGVVEIQGDHRDRIVALLGGRYRVKPAGG